MFQHTKQILGLAIPSIATFSSMTLTGMISLIIVGHLGPVAIAVVGVSNIVMYNVWALCVGLGNSINFLVSQNYGAGDMDKANQRVQVALLITGCLCVVLIAAATSAPAEILRLVGTAPSVVAAGTPYLRLRFVSFVFSVFSLVFMGYMRGVGNTRTPMYISVASSILLVGLTYCLTYGELGFPRLGLSGAALAMVASEAFTLGMCLWVYYVPFAKKYGTRRIQPFSGPETQLIAWESFKLGGLETAQSLSMLVFTTCIATLGTTALAANEIALNILSFGFMPANGFGATSTILVGQEVGAGRPTMARRYGHETTLLGVLFMACFSVILLALREPVAHLYTADANVALRASSLILLAAFVQIFDGANIIYGGGLRGAGDTTFLFRASLACSWLMFVPLTLLTVLVFHMGATGAWISLCAQILGLGLINTLRFIRLEWAQLLPRTASETRLQPDI